MIAQGAIILGKTFDEVLTLTLPQLELILKQADVLNAFREASFFSAVGSAIGSAFADKPADAAKEYFKGLFGRFHEEEPTVASRKEILQGYAGFGIRCKPLKPVANGEEKQA